MNKSLVIAAVILLILYFLGLFNELVLLFKDDDGRTNWQYVANWSSGILIILLSALAIILFFSRREKDKANTELQAIKNDLEIRVQERTATLDESNRLLKKEVEQHRETTARLHASENYITNILRLMPTMLVGLNPQGQITQWNQKAEEYTGLKTPDALGKNLWEAYPVITVTPSQVQDAIEQQTTLNFRQAQRGLFHYDVSIYPLQGAAETGVVILIDDVTHQVKSDNQLIQRDRMSSMGELASSMANDISVPLQSMLSTIQWMDEKAQGLMKSADAPIFHELHGKLLDVLKRGEQASAIVRNLLDFASSHDKSKQQANMIEVMDHSLDLAQRILTSPQGLKFSDITIEKNYDPDISRVWCHVSEIQQVFLSLLRHSFHALAEHDPTDFTPTLKVKILECYDALWFKISHNGVGLSIEEQQSIFEPYFSHDPLNTEYDADKRLSFPHFIITEHHDGEMAVTSDPRVGTTFHMQLHLKK